MKDDPKNLDKRLKDAGYKFLGWQNGWKTKPYKNPAEVKAGESIFNGYENQPEHSFCRKQGHKVDEVQHTRTGSENTVSCDECKIYWKYDCSD